MKLNFRILIGLAFLCTQQSCGQKYTYSDKYNFHFKYDQEDIHSQLWNISRLSWLSSIQMSRKENGQHMLTFLRPKRYPISRNLIVEFEQRILLPVNDEQKGKVFLSFKGENIENSELIVTGLDNGEGFLYSDTLSLKTDTVMKTTSFSVSLSNVKLLNIKIAARGFLDAESSFSMSGVNVFLGEKTIDAYPLTNSGQEILFPAEKIIPLDIGSGQGLGRIDSLNNKKIIAVGESVHGSNAIAEMIPRFIQQQVIQNNCRLVIVEIPMEQTLLYNKYVRDTSFIMDKEYLFGVGFEHMLEWLREYNSHKDEADKVTILGMDYCSFLNAKNTTAFYLFEYLTSINKKNRSKEIDSLSVLLSEKPLKESIDYLQKQKKLKEELSPEDYKCISHILNVSYLMGTDENRRVLARDSVMFENAKFLINNYCPANGRTFIHAHSAHLNRISGYPSLPDVVSLGAMMSRYYQDDFYNITIQVGNGSLFLPDTKMVRNCHPLESLDSTLETELGKIRHNVFFTYIPDCLDKLIFSRYVGSIFRKQCFYPFNIYRRYDGIIFIRDTECDMDAVNEKMILESLEKHKKVSLDLLPK